MSWMDKRKEHGTGDQGFEPMPKGDYLVEIKTAELVPTKNKSGKMLKLQMVVIQEQFNGRHVFERLNVENANPVAERIGLEQLNQLIECAGLDDPQSEQELVGCSVGVHLKIRADEGYEPDNEVSYFKKPGDVGATAAPKTANAGATAGAPAEAGAGTQKKPWEK